MEFPSSSRACWIDRAGAKAAHKEGSDEGENLRSEAQGYAARLLAEGKQVFRFDTFGSEEFWGGRLKLHDAIQGARHGGVGKVISPKKASEFGLKVDMRAVPAQVPAGIRSGAVDLDDPASTVVLFRANAVVGVTGFFGPDGRALSSEVANALSVHQRSTMLSCPVLGGASMGGLIAKNVGAIIASVRTSGHYNRHFKLNLGE